MGQIQNCVASRLYHHVSYHNRSREISSRAGRILDDSLLNTLFDVVIDGNQDELRQHFHGLAGKEKIEDVRLFVLNDAVLFLLQASSTAMVRRRLMPSPRWALR